MLEKANTCLENKVVKHLDIQPDHQILEVGFGPGAGLEAALKKVEHGNGKVHGVDISEQMVIKVVLNLLGVSACVPEGG